MTCDKYENALLLAAASDDKLDAKLARHLEHCSTCRMTLRSERELFSRIDRTLRAQVNEDPPSAFLAHPTWVESRVARGGSGLGVSSGRDVLSVSPCATIKRPRKPADAHD